MGDSEKIGKIEENEGIEKMDLGEKGGIEEVELDEEGEEESGK